MSRRKDRHSRNYAKGRARADHHNMMQAQRLARSEALDREAYEAERERLRQLVTDEAQRAAILEEKALRDVRGRERGKQE